LGARLSGTHLLEAQKGSTIEQKRASINQQDPSSELNGFIVPANFFPVDFYRV
jgi:hypothetical protein